MNLHLRILKLKQDFQKIFNSLAGKYNLNSINQLNESVLNKTYEEILDLKIDNYHKKIFREIIAELQKILYYSEQYTQNEIRNSTNQIEKNLQIIKRNFPDLEDDSSERQTMGEKIRALNAQKEIEKEVVAKIEPAFNESQQNDRKIEETTKDESSEITSTSNSKLYELLQNISDRSKEAIMNPHEFSDVKNYLHVETEIQKELEEAIKVANNSDTSQLIILCGNVGDGKSHLLSFLKNKHPEWFKNITIYNDATESNDPTRTAIETLEEELKLFNDLNIDDSTEKMVLAINIGILNNFINEMNAKGKYQKLIHFLTDTTLYKTEGINHSEDRKMHVVSFFEHSNLKLKNNQVESFFYEEIFERLFNETENNIFYSAYLQDRINHNEDIVHDNYELMLNKNIREKLLFILYRIQIQYNVIISVRALNSFLYEILVPNNKEEYQYSSFLPFLLFDSQNNSEIFRAVKQLDPVTNINNNMNKKFNKINIAYYNSENYFETTKNLINDVTLFNRFIKLIRSIDKEPMKREMHATYIKAYLRMIYLFEESKQITDEKIYSEYIELLYATENFQDRMQEGNKIVINQFRQLVIDGIKKWNGSISEKSIFIDNDMDSNIATAVNLNLAFYSIKREGYSIVIEFKETYRQVKHQLIIDFNLFKLLQKINYGYVLKDEDKRENVYFQQFMNSIIYKTNSLESTVIIDKETNKKYELVDNGFSIEIN